MSVKNRTLVFISLIFILFSAATLSVVYVHQKKEIKTVENEYFENVQALYEKVTKKYKKFYTHRILEYSNIKEVKDALKNRDKEFLYKLLIDRWRTLQNENQDLVIMNFHIPDDTILLKMNEPESVYDKNNIKLVTKVHRSREAVFGFEEYENSVTYRVIYPVFDGPEYLGAMEFGLKVDSILREMNYNADTEGVLFIKDKKEFKLNYKVLSDYEMLKNFSKDDSFWKYENIISLTISDSIYSIYSFDIKNYSDATIAKVMFIKNITKDIDEFKNNMFNIFIFLLLLICITLIIVNFGFNRSIKNLENNYIDVSEYKVMIDKNVMIVNANKEGKIIEVSTLFCEISGYTKDELIGKSCEIIRDPSVPTGVYDGIFESLRNNGYWSGELKNRKKDSEIYWVKVKIHAKISNGVLVGFNSIMHDITKKKLNEKLLLTDGLTNIYNRRYFNEIFPRMIKRIKRDGGCFNFLILDVDNFKKYNDTYGHQDGDTALIAIANVLKDSIHRPDDYCFRLGGEEFGLLYKSANEDEGYLFAQRLRKNIEMLGIKHEGNMTHKVLTASFGLVSLVGGHITDEKTIYKLADEHLYRAKKDGRNKVVSKLL